MVRVRVSKMKKKKEEVIDTKLEFLKALDNIVKEKNIDNFTNLKKELREKIKSDFCISFIKIKKCEKGEGVRKYLFELNDNKGFVR